MKRTEILATIFVGVATCLPMNAYGPMSQRSEADIRNMMAESVVAWNRGDLDAFAHCYKHSDDILMVGPTNRKGYAAVLGTYLKNYPDAATRGTLSYSGIEVQPLDNAFATVTGHFHLDRTAAGGGNVNGYYLLVLEKTQIGWRIVRDASALDPVPRGK